MRSGRAEVPWEMDPLRCGAGEAGAFHPQWKLWKQYEQKPFAPAFPVCGARVGNLFRRSAFQRVQLMLTASENSSESRGLNSLFRHATLRIPLRPVSRPAQEERNECTSLRNLLRIT